MLKNTKRAISALLTTVMVATSMAVAPLSTYAANAISVTKSGAWYESVYAEWSNYSNASDYNVYYKKSSGGSYLKAHAALIRNNRVDIPGLPAGTYTIKIVPVISGSEASNAATEISGLSVKSFERSGFAFQSQIPSDSTTGAKGGSIGTASGGYNDDGSVPLDAVILYLNDANRNTIELDVITNSKGSTTSCTGIGAIMKAKEKGYDKRPLIIRVLGKVRQFDSIGSTGMLDIKKAENVTFEGIGEDAYLYGWGVNIRASRNIEIRNLGFVWFTDDAISAQTDNRNLWIHNNEIFYGSPGGDADQKKGDGSCDVKANSSYVTVAYNHFVDAGKSSLCGLSENKEFFVTYANNWFDHSDSRHPRVRTGTIHVYNNYFDNNNKYGIGATCGSSIFSQSNYFENCKYPMLISLQGSDISAGKGTFSSEPGGVIKAYGNTIVGGTFVEGTDAYMASSSNATVPSSFKTKVGNNIYNNFDTQSYMSSYFKKANVISSNAVKANVKANSGRMNGGDISYDLNSISSSIDGCGRYTALVNILPDANNYSNSSSSLRDSKGNVITAPPVSVVIGGEIIIGDETTTESTTESTTKKETTTEATTKKETTTEATTKKETTTEATTESSTETTTESAKDAVSMGTYKLNSSNISSKNCTANNIAFSLREVNSTGIKLRSTNSISFKVSKDCTLTLNPSSKGAIIKASSGSVNGKRSYTTSTGTVTVTLTAGSYVITGSASGSNTSLTYLTFNSNSNTTETTTETTTKETTTTTTTTESTTESTTETTTSGDCVALGNYSLNSSTISDKNCTVNNITFNLRDVNSSGIKLRSANSISFKVANDCTLSLDPSGSGLVITAKSGSVNGSSSITTDIETVNVKLTAGTYVITGSKSGSNTVLTYLSLN